MPSAMLFEHFIQFNLKYDNEDRWGLGGGVAVIHTYVLFRCLRVQSTHVNVAGW